MFSTIKPNLPVITEHYEIRNPVFHLPAIKHKFAESSLQYCLIKLINEQNCFNEMTDKVQRTSIYSFKVFLKRRVLDTYKSTCKIDKCKTCAIINMELTLFLICKSAHFVKIIALVCSTFTMRLVGPIYSCLQIFIYSYTCTLI